MFVTKKCEIQRKETPQTRSQDWKYKLLQWVSCMSVSLTRIILNIRRSNQPILKEISSEYSLEGQMLKLELQYFGHLMRRTDSLGKTLKLGKIEGRRRGVRQRIRWLDGITDSMDMSLSNSGSWWWTGRPGVLQSMGSQRVWHDWATELNWSDCCINIILFFTSISLSALVDLVDFLYYSIFNFTDFCSHFYYFFPPSSFRFKMFFFFCFLM